MPRRRGDHPANLVAMKAGQAPVEGPRLRRAPERFSPEHDHKSVTIIGTCAPPSDVPGGIYSLASLVDATRMAISASTVKPLQAIQCTM